MSAQSMDALKIANRVRLGAAALRREITAGVTTIEQALWDERAQSLPIGRLLCAQRQYGPKRTQVLLNQRFIWPTRQVRQLSDGQKRAIVRALER